MPVVQLSNNEAYFNEFAQLSSSGSITSAKRNLGNSDECSDSQKCAFPSSSSSTLLDDFSVGYSIANSTADDFSIAYSIANNSVITSSNGEIIVEESSLSCSPTNNNNNNTNEYHYETRTKYNSILENNKILSSRLKKSQQIILSLKEEYTMLSTEFNKLKTEKDALTISNGNITILLTEVDKLKTDKDHLQKANKKLNQQFEEYKNRESTLCWKRMKHRLECNSKFTSCDLSLPIYKKSNKQSLRDFIQSSGSRNNKTSNVDDFTIYSEIAQYIFGIDIRRPQSADVGFTNEISKPALNLTEPNTKRNIITNDENNTTKSERSSSSEDKTQPYFNSSDDNRQQMTSEESNLDLSNCDSARNSLTMSPIIEESILYPSSSNEEKETSIDEKELDYSHNDGSLSSSFSIEANTRRSSTGFQTLSLSSDQANDIILDDSSQQQHHQRRFNGLMSRWTQKAEARAKHRAKQKAVTIIKSNSHQKIKDGITDDADELKNNSVGLLKSIRKLSRKNVRENSQSSDLSTTIDDETDKLDSSSKTSEFNSSDDTLTDLIDSSNNIDMTISSANKVESNKLKKTQKLKPQQPNIIYFR